MAAITLANLKAKLQTAVAGIAAIKTVQVGYLTELNTGQENFDLLLIIPPDDVLPENLAAWSSKDMILKVFLIRLDQNFNESEKIAAWDALTASIKTLVKAFVADSQNIQVLSPRPVIKRNSIGAGQGLIIAESIIWVELNMTIKVIDC